MYILLMNVPLKNIVITCGNTHQLPRCGFGLTCSWRVPRMRQVGAPADWAQQPIQCSESDGKSQGHSGSRSLAWTRYWESDPSEKRTFNGPSAVDVSRFPLFLLQVWNWLFPLDCDWPIAILGKGFSNKNELQVRSWILPHRVDQDVGAIRSG